MSRGIKIINKRPYIKLITSIPGWGAAISSGKLIIVKKMTIITLEALLFLDSRT